MARKTERLLLQCKRCQQQFEVTLKGRNRKFCSRTCVDAFQTGAGNPAFGKVYRTKESHPEWAAKTSATHRERGTLIGDKNPMKRADVAARMSKTRREKVTSDPAYRAHLSQKMREAWVDGKFEGVRVGQCDWHDHTRPNGTLVKCQGTWELKFAQFLDARSIDYEMHVGRIPYVDDAGVAHSYYPDFRITALDAYIDVKNPLYEREHAPKIAAVQRSNPDIILVVMGKQRLEELGVI